MASKKVSFQSEGVTLRGDFFAPEKNIKSQAALFLHGWTGKANTNAAETLASNGFYAMTFSLPGHNDSDGEISTLTREQSCQAVQVALSYLRSLIPADTKIAIVGNSYGGYMAALISGEPDINALSLRVPADYPDDKFDLPQIGQGHENPKVTEWRSKMHDFTETKALRMIHEFDGKVQVIEAERDDVVPHATVQSYVQAVSDASKLEYHLMKDWPHSLGSDPARNKQYRTILLSWLENL